MIELITNVEEKIKNILNELKIDVDKVQVVESSRPELAQYQYNGAMALANKNGFKPQELAQIICDKLMDEEYIYSATVANAGFVNIKFNNSALINQLNNLNKEIDKICEPKNYTIFIDYGGPNVAKALHVGHLRSANIGEGLKRLAKKVGYEVISDVHFGDWGRQMGMVLAGIQEKYPDLPFFDENFEGIYPTKSPVSSRDLEYIYPYINAKAKEDVALMDKCRQMTYELQKGRKGYVELWKLFVQESLNPVLDAFKFLNVSFDLYEGESTCNDLIAPMVQDLCDRNIAYLSQGAVVIDVQEESDKIEVPPFIVLKSDGAAMYSTTDLATIISRHKRFSPNEFWYVTDNRQSLHFIQLFRASHKAHYVDDETKLYNLTFGTMNGKDGKPFKTRDGGVMSVLTLIENVKTEITKKMQGNGVEDEKVCEIISSATLKFADLSNNRETDFIFDIDKFCALEGKTGPYVLYSTVRANSVLNKVSSIDINECKLVDIENEAYMDVILNAMKAPMILQKAFDQKALNIICDFVFNLSNSFNNFYAKTKILTESDEIKKRAYLKLCKIVSQINEMFLEILAIKIPEKM